MQHNGYAKTRSTPSDQQCVSTDQDIGDPLMAKKIKTSVLNWLLRSGEASAKRYVNMGVYYL